jgi:hypothetical protein
MFKREDGCMKINYLGQRNLDDYTPDGLGLLTVISMKSPRYGKGYSIIHHVGKHS